MYLYMSKVHNLDSDELKELHTRLEVFFKLNGGLAPGKAHLNSQMAMLISCVDKGRVGKASVKISTDLNYDVSGEDTGRPRYKILRTHDGCSRKPFQSSVGAPRPTRFSFRVR